MVVEPNKKKLMRVHMIGLSVPVVVYTSPATDKAIESELDIIKTIVDVSYL